jgi:H+-transporting ATPase
MGMEVLNHPAHRELFSLADAAQLQTVMFLQLVAGGHLLLFITRDERWFFLPPFPAAPLFFAIVLTQLVAVAMCAAGWLVEPISWKVIGAVWAYNIAWMFVMGAVRLMTERYADHRTARQLRSVRIVNQRLHP